jgi:septal ring factor EnvC (AmiA/AmiB activator)
MRGGFEVDVAKNTKTSSEIFLIVAKIVSENIKAEKGQSYDANFVAPFLLSDTWIPLDLYKKAIEQLEKRLQKAEKDSAFLETKFKETFKEKEKLLMERDEHKNKLKQILQEFPKTEGCFPMDEEEQAFLLQQLSELKKRFGELVGE